MLMPPFPYLEARTFTKLKGFVWTQKERKSLFAFLENAGVQNNLLIALKKDKIWNSSDATLNKK
jgi:hypothetical protein